MEIRLSDAERSALTVAAAAERRVRVWKRWRAVLLLAEGQAPTAVAATLGCCRASVYGWAAAWRRDGLAGLAEGPHRGRARHLSPTAEQQLVALLAADPQAYGHQATGWTVPLLRTELAARGEGVSERTLRRTLHRLGYRWKRPKFVLGRPDPAYAEKRGSWPRGLA